MENNVRTFIQIFAGIFYEALPFIVLGAIIAGFLEEFVPQRLILKLIPRNRFLAIVLGALLGLPFPMCECGILVIMRRLLRKGVPLSCCVSYMLAGPIINVVVMLSTYVAFTGMESTTDSSGRLTNQMGGVAMVTARMLGGFLVAVGTGLVVEWQHRRHGNKLLAADLAADMPASQEDPDATVLEKRPSQLTFPQRIGNVAEIALHDFVDITVFLILGALIAAFARLTISHNDVEEISRNQPAVAILLMMGLAILLCLCSEADAFVAASFIALRPSAKIAFLVLGPMLDFKLYMMYLRVFHPRLIWSIILSVVVQVFIYSMLLHFLWETYGPRLSSALADR
ncbi:MAG: permease [Gemmataceae bacterium]|nr:permease [Gemmataceae bacterium]